MLTGWNRRAKSPPRHDQVARESRSQDYFHCEPRQRPHPTHHYHRCEPVSVSDRRQSQVGHGERLAATHRPFLDTKRKPGAAPTVYTTRTTSCEEREVQHRLEMTT
jgi:hypothetical protein